MKHAPARIALSQTDFTAALLDPQRPCPQGLRTWNSSDPMARMAVYRNNFVGSLIDALTETFPVTQQLVGVEFFRAMAAVFVRQAPPTSRILAFYGDEFPGFIAQFEPARSLAYLADVARLEMARVKSYHAADAEPVAAEAVSLALASGEHMGELRMMCHPSVFTVASPFAVVSLWAAHQGEADIAHIDVDQTECAIVVRQNLEVLVLPAPQGAASFVAAVQEGCNLEDATASAARRVQGFDLAATLSLLLSHGALVSIHLPRRHDP